MPIDRLYREGKIKPEEVERLNRAFTFTLRSLHLVDRNDPVCDIVARKVMRSTRLAFTIPKRSQRWPRENSASRGDAASVGRPANFAPASPLESSN